MGRQGRLLTRRGAELGALFCALLGVAGCESCGPVDALIERPTRRSTPRALDMSAREAIECITYEDCPGFDICRDRRCVSPCECDDARDCREDSVCLECYCIERSLLIDMRPPLDMNQRREDVVDMNTVTPADMTSNLSDMRPPEDMSAPRPRDMSSADMHAVDMAKRRRDMSSDQDMSESEDMSVHHDADM